MEDDENLTRLRFQVFTNQLILDIILQHLSLEDLKTFRLVCRFWNQKANKIFHQKACVNLKEWGNLTRYYKKKKGISLCPEIFLQIFGALNNSYNELKQDEQSDNNLVNTFHKLNFQSYKLNNWDWSDRSMYIKEESEFWNSFGSTIKYLHLQNCLLGKSSFGMLRKIMEGRLVPNMDTLVLENSDFLGCVERVTSKYVNLRLKKLEVLGPIPFDDWSFLKMFPNLERLKIAKQCCSERLFKDLCKLKESSPTLSIAIPNLSQLDIMDTYQSLNMFPCDLPLKNLTFRISRSTKSQDVANILENYSNSLEELGLFRTLHCDDTPFPNFSIKNVTFSQLTNLELWGNFTFNFNFLRSTSALKRLLIDVGCYDKRSILDYYYPKSWKAEKYCPINGSKIHSVNIPKADGFALSGVGEFVTDVVIGVGEWKELTHWMPNLTTIKAPLDKVSLEVVCANWGNLEHLKMRFPSDVDDEGITGLVNGECTPTGAYACVSNVSQLKYLKYFETEVKCGIAKLTDHSATMGFLKMESLQRLSIYASDKLSENTVQLLRERIAYVQVWRNNWSGNSTDQQECCAWARHYHRFFTCHCAICQPTTTTSAKTKVKNLHQQITW